MASQTKVQKKVKELQKIYANDRMKLQMETQKLYEKEGVSMTGGCLPMLIPFPIMLGIYYSVLFPLRNALHIAAERVMEATQIDVYKRQLLILLRDTMLCQSSTARFSLFVFVSFLRYRYIFTPFLYVSNTYPCI